MNYCSMVLSESVRIYFTVAVLNEMNIVSGYIGNMYVNTKPLKKCHVTIKDVFMFCQKVLITECPRLNITVKKVLKDLGGKIITQSGMAKGPDETNSFRQGWTTRQSL